MESKKISSRRHFPKSYTSCGFDLISHQSFDRNNLMVQSFPRSKISEKSSNNQDKTLINQEKSLIQKSHSFSSLPQARPVTGLVNSVHTEYRDNYKPFLYGYKVLPVVVSPVDESLTGLIRNNHGQMVIELPNGGGQDNVQNLKESVIDGPILVPIEKVLINPNSSNFRSKEKIKSRKTEYKAKFRPFSAYVYISGTGFRKPKDIDPMSVTPVNDWLFEVSERSAKAAEFSRRSKFGHPIVGADNLEAIYAKESKGPWYKQSRDQSEAIKTEINMINLNKFKRGSMASATIRSETTRSGSASRVERNDRSMSTAPVEKRRNQSADRVGNKLSPTTVTSNGFKGKSLLLSGNESFN